MPNLFFRDGRNFAGKPCIDSKGKPVTTVSHPCSRCGGAGGSDAWKHTGWKCYQCGGSGRGADVVTALYTLDQIDVLNARKAKIETTKRAKADAAYAKQQAETNARRAAFEAEFADILLWLRVQGTTVQTDTEDSDYREGFLGEILRHADKYAMFSVPQANALRNTKIKFDNEDAKRSASQWIGNIGERLKNIPVTVVRVSSYQRAAYSGYGQSETVWIVTMRTNEHGDTIVSKSPTFNYEKDTKLILTATVTKHDSYNGEAQTIVSRPIATLPVAPAPITTKEIKAAIKGFDVKVERWDVASANNDMERGRTREEAICAVLESISYRTGIMFPCVNDKLVSA